MIIKSFFLLIFNVMVCLIVPQHLYAGPQTHGQYKDFISDLGNNVIKILVNKEENMAKRKARFRAEIQNHFALKSIGRFIIARYWRRMNETQQTQYLQLFENAVIENYASQFDDYDNEKLIIKSSRETSDGGIVVKSDVRRPGGGEPLHISWKVFNTKRGMKVLDVIVNNVSMSITLRNEYASAIQNRGNIEGFLDYLREKIRNDQEAQEE